MIIVYESAAGVELDRLTLDGAGLVVEATTGKGRDIVTSTMRRYGVELGLRVLRSWSNGYVLTREVKPDAAVSD